MYQKVCKPGTELDWKQSTLRAQKTPNLPHSHTNEAVLLLGHTCARMSLER